MAIIAAPNGYGKTTILKMIDSFSKGDFFIFFRESFKEVRFYLSYGKVIQNIKKSDNSEQDIIITDGEYSNTINDPLNDNQFIHWVGNDSNLLIVFYVQIMPDDFVMQLHRF